MNIQSERRKLLARRAELVQRLESIRQDYIAGLDPDLEEQAIQLENHEVLEQLNRQAVEELSIINYELEELEKKERTKGLDS